MPEISSLAPEFSWTTKSEEAANDLALGELTDDAIATKAGIAPRTLRYWKTNPEFAGRVEEILGTFRARVRRRGLAVLERRIEALNGRWLDMIRIIDERGADPTMATVPGGTTGLLTRTLKTVGSGPNAKVVALYEVDVALLREIREHEKQAAQELGQWVEKQTVDQHLKAYVTESPDTLWLEDDRARELACELDERLASLRGDAE